LVYINDITDDLESDVLIFADDTSLMCSGKNTLETSIILNRDLKKIEDWAQKWKVLFNSKKSKFMIYTSKHGCNSPPLIFNDKEIEQVHIHKHLGIFISSNLDWTKQIDYICLKANQRLGILRKNYMLQRQTLDILYKLTVRSIFDYALPVYFNSLKITEKDRLDRIQYRAAKLVTGTLNYTNKSKLYQELGWETVQARADYLGLTLFHKIHSNETRPLIRRNMQPYKPNQNLRGKGTYQPFLYKNVKYKNSFYP